LIIDTDTLDTLTIGYFDTLKGSDTSVPMGYFDEAGIVDKDTSIADT
jgi:hypothetical protein